MIALLIFISLLVIVSIIIISVYVGYYLGKRSEIKRMESLKDENLSFYEVKKKIINGTLFTVCIRLPYFLQKKIETGLYEAYEFGLSHRYMFRIDSNTQKEIEK